MASVPSHKENPAKVLQLLDSVASITKVSPATAPPGVMPQDTAIYYSQLAFNNSNPLTSIGYILEALPGSTSQLNQTQISDLQNGQTITANWTNPEGTGACPIATDQ